MGLTERERIEMDEAAYGVTGLRGPDNRELYIVDLNEEHGSWYLHGTLMHHPGAMYRFPKLDADGRECWVIVLPNRAGAWWTTYRAGGEPTGALWEISGDPPKLTVNPSINAGDGPDPHNWHGFIKDGVMNP